MMTDDSTTKQERNVTRTVGVNALHKIRAEVDDINEQDRKNKPLSITLVVLSVILFFTIIYFLANKDPSNIILQADQSGSITPKTPDTNSQ